jgi:hypothetical protein
MIWLQDSYYYDMLAHFDPDTGNYELSSRKQEANIEIDGLFIISSGIFMALYKCNSNLFVRVADTIVWLSHDVIIEVDDNVEGRVLSIVKAGQEIMRHGYQLGPWSPIPNDPTPGVDAEDNDFGLLISNISKSNERKSVLTSRVL